MPSPLRLMHVHAHPDDESSKGAATYAHYVDSGAEVLIVSCTGGERGDLAEGQEAFHAVADAIGHTGAHQRGGAGGKQDLAVGGKVVEVGVRHEAPRHRVVGVEPPVELRQV
jgi:hypothetical protein